MGKNPMRKILEGVETMLKVGFENSFFFKVSLILRLLSCFETRVIKRLAFECEKSRYNSFLFSNPFCSAKLKYKKFLRESNNIDHDLGFSIWHAPCVVNGGTIWLILGG